MVEYTLPQDSGLNFSEGLDQLFVYVAREVPLFIPLVLISFGILIFMGGYIAQKKATGNGDGLQWFAIASFSVTILSFTMILIEGLINLETVMICLGITFVSGMLFLLNKRR